MHELSVTENLLKVVIKHAGESARVLRIHLVVGEMASIVDDSVQFYFDFLAQNTVAEGAVLVFRRVPVTLDCPACHHQWQPNTADWSCPACSASRAVVASGREFYIDSIEVE
jgi:hydrogenase nickel incorporation protein HypA/HybF